jgi:anti-anti-sigma factor
MDTAAEHPESATEVSGHDDGQWLCVDVVATSESTIARLRVTGELDRTAAGELRRSVAEALSVPVPTKLEIDAGGLTVLDSSGIRCLLSCRKNAEAAGSRLVVIYPAPIVYQVLEITGLLDLFAVARQPTPTTTVVHARAVDKGRTMQQTRQQAAQLRRTARETRQRAAVMRDADALRRLRLLDGPPGG